MTEPTRRRQPSPLRAASFVLAASAGFVLAAWIGIAAARSFTLRVARDAPVMNASGAMTHENIVIDSKGFAVYDLSGNSRRDRKCTRADGCFKFWPPATVSSAEKLSKAPGISGKLGTWRHDGILQLTLSGHPLYTFAGDSRQRAANGEGIKGFNGTWHVIRAAGSSTASNPGTVTGNTTPSGTTTGTGTTDTTGTSSTGTTNTGTTTTPTCVYSPCY